MFGYFQEPVHHFCIFNIKLTNLRNLVIRAIYVTKFVSPHPLCKSLACPANNRCRARSVRCRVANRAGLWRAARGTGRCIQRGEEQRNKRSTADEQVKKKKEKKKGLLGALPREERKLIAQSAGARGKSTPATKNFNQ